MISFYHDMVSLCLEIATANASKWDYEIKLIDSTPHCPLFEHLSVLQIWTV